MKVRLVLTNSLGYCKETSIEMDVEIVPRIGEYIWINTLELLDVLEAADATPDYCDGMDEYNEDMLTVVDIRHDYTEDNFGVYIILAYNPEDYH